MVNTEAEKNQPSRNDGAEVKRSGLDYRCTRHDSKSRDCSDDSTDDGISKNSRCCEIPYEKLAVWPRPAIHKTENWEEECYVDDEVCDENIKAGNIKDRRGPVPKQIGGRSERIGKTIGGVESLGRTENLSRLHVVTLATHTDSYFSTLIQSAFLLSIDLKILKWREKWTGFCGRLRAIAEYCSHLPPDQIVLSIDAFDTFFVQPANVIVERFKAFGGRIVLGSECLTYHSYTWKKVFQSMFHHMMFNSEFEWPQLPLSAPPLIDLYMLNAGTFIGYAGDIVDILKGIPSSDAANDQVFWTSEYVKDPNKRITIDCWNHLFLTWRSYSDVELLPPTEAKELYPYQRPLFCFKDATTHDYQNETSGTDQNDMVIGRKDNEEIDDPSISSTPSTVSSKEPSPILSFTAPSSSTSKCRREASPLSSSHTDKEMRRKREYGEIDTVSPFPLTVCDLKTKSTPCIIHAHMRRDVDNLCHKLGLAKGFVTDTITARLFYVWYSFVGSYKAFLFLCTPMVALCLSLTFISTSSLLYQYDFVDKTLFLPPSSTVSSPPSFSPLSDKDLESVGMNKSDTGDSEGLHAEKYLGNDCDVAISTFLFLYLVEPFISSYVRFIFYLWHPIVCIFYVSFVWFVLEILFLGIFPYMRIQRKAKIEMRRREEFRQCRERRCCRAKMERSSGPVI